MATTLDLGNLLVHLKMEASQYMRMMRQVEARMKRTAQRMTALGKQMTLRITVPLALMGTASVKAFASFDDAMTKSLAIMSNITPTLRKEMERLALEISTEGVTSAKDLAKSYFFLASAGLDARQSMAALGAVQRFAVAGAFDMATATDLATDAQSALGLTVKDAERNLINMTRVTDVLTGANTLANASTEQFSLALTSQAGPAMKAYGIALEEGVAVLAAYADQGIKAQTAGNMFSRMLRLMTKGFIDNQKVWEEFHVNIFDATGELKPLYEIVGDLSNALGAMSTKQKIATLQMLGFQARSQQAILPLLGLQDRIKGYNEELLKMQGITKEVADKQLKSFSSQMKILKNQLVFVGIEIGHILSPIILVLNERVKDLIKSWKELDDTTKKLIVNISLVAAGLGPLLIVLGVSIKIVTVLGAVVLSTTGALLAMVAAIVAIKNAPSIGEFFFEEFKIVQHVASQVVINLMKGWEYLKFGFKQMVAGIRIVWDKFASYLLGSFASLISEIAGGFGVLEDLINKLPWIEKVALGSEKIEEWAVALDKFAVSVGGTGKKMWEQNKKDLETQLQFLNDLSAEVFKDIEANFAKAEEAATTATKETAEAAEKSANDMKKSMEDLSWKIHDLFEDWVGVAIDTFHNLRDIVSDSLEGISDELTELVMTGKADFHSLAQSILRDVTQMIIKAQMARAIMSFFPGLIPTPIAPPQPVYQVPSPVGFHSGGLVVAPRFHNGLASDEVPAILQQGEMVLSKNDVSQLGGGRQKPSPTINIYNYIDNIDAQGTYRFLEQNKRAIASMLQTTMHSNHPIRRDRV